VQYPALAALKIGSFITCLSRRTVALMSLASLLYFFYWGSRDRRFIGTFVVIGFFEGLDNESRYKFVAVSSFLSMFSGMSAK